MNELIKSEQGDEFDIYWRMKKIYKEAREKSP